MQSLQDVYNQIASQDAELEKQASELIKQAEEEDAAGRITARGFADELSKLAAGYSKIAAGFDPSTGSEFNTGPKGGSFNPGKGETIKSKPGFDLGLSSKSMGSSYNMGGGATRGQMQKRHAQSQMAASMAGGNSNRVVGAPPAKPPRAPAQSGPRPGQVAAGSMKPPGA